MIYKPHKLALLLPPMSDDQREALKNDIRDNGLVDPITLYENKVLDGVNRQAICVELGVEPRYEQFNGDSPVQYVLSKNVHRRHLTPEERAVVAAELEPFFQAEARKRQRNGGDAGRRARHDSGFLPNGKKPESGRNAADDAAAAVGASSRNTGRAIRVKKNDPDLFDQVKAGKVSLNEAEQRVAVEEADRRSGRSFTKATAEPKRKPRNWNGKTNAARERELRERRRQTKAKSDNYNELLRLQMTVAKYTRVLEGWDTDEYQVDEGTLALVADLWDDLVTMAEWVDRTETSVGRWLSDSDRRATIAKLRDVKGRTREEAETALRLADRLERKLEARLTA